MSKHVGCRARGRCAASGGTYAFTPSPHPSRKFHMAGCVSQAFWQATVEGFCRRRVDQRILAASGERKTTSMHDKCYSYLGFSGRGIVKAPRQRHGTSWPRLLAEFAGRVLSLNSETAKHNRVVISDLRWIQAVEDSSARACRGVLAERLGHSTPVAAMPAKTSGCRDRIGLSTSASLLIHLQEKSGFRAVLRIPDTFLIRGTQEKVMPVIDNDRGQLKPLMLIIVREAAVLASGR